jgi:hypothetical protein
MNQLMRNAGQLRLAAAATMAALVFASSAEAQRYRMTVPKPNNWVVRGGARAAVPPATTLTTRSADRVAAPLGTAEAVLRRSRAGVPASRMTETRAGATIHPRLLANEVAPYARSMQPARLAVASANETRLLKGMPSQPPSPAHNAVPGWSAPRPNGNGISLRSSPQAHAAQEALAAAGRSWTTQQRTFWRVESATKEAAQRWGGENLDRIRTGRAPQYADVNGRTHSVELDHTPVPQRAGGTRVEPKTREQHARDDPYRKVGGR